MIQLLVVIVNYKTPQLTIDTLHSLVEEIQALPYTKVVVVDNNSSDGSVDIIQNALIQHQWQEWASVVASQVNGGFAYGNNLAIREALASTYPPDYILLLNPDTIVRPKALQILLQFMDTHPEAGIAGSRLEDTDTTPQRSAFRFHTIWSELDGSLRLGVISRLLHQFVIAPEISDVSCLTDWVAGASMIVRREVFEQVGLMDEKYFMYYEETDFCLQAKRAGWQCWYVPESRVVHLVGQSSGVTNTKVAPKRRPQYWFDSRRRYFVKNFGFLYAIMADTVWLSGFLLWNLRRLLEGKPYTEPPKFLVDFWKNMVIFTRTST